MAEPFLKWVGGKRQLLPELLPRVPKKYGTYYEPFLGGGALFFALEPERAVLGDVNSRLITTYEWLSHAPDLVIGILNNMHYTRVAYDTIRQWFNARAAVKPVETAAMFIYLNKTCFNGLYRENARGEFNVPMGRYTNPTICDEPRLRACAAAMGEARLYDGDFSTIEPKRGDFVYFDPPYIPVSATSDFTGYTKSGFTFKDQERLRDFAWALRERKVHVMLSNSSSPLVYELYKRFDIHEASARRAVNSDASKRGAVKELIIT